MSIYSNEMRSAIVIPAVLSDMELELEKARQQLVSAKVCKCISTHFSVYSSFV